MKKILFGGTHSGAGKTTITLGVMHALALRQYIVQPYKVGPDYIDTAWHSLATGRKSCNLDAFMVPENTLCSLFQEHAKQVDINIIEGVMGLYDGFGEDLLYCSSAGMAKTLDCPVILVIDGKAVSTSVAATVLGFQKICPEISIAGVIVNRVNTEGHYNLIRQAIERYCQIPLLGRLPNLPELALPSRHLGLVPPEEMSEMQAYWVKLAEVVEEYIDLDAILEISEVIPQSTDALDVPGEGTYSGLKVAIAYDEAFHFYYRDNLEILQKMGLELIYFSPLKDQEIPECDLVYIGGGFPEMFAKELAANVNMRRSILAVHQQQKPIYAECGGLMYLGEKLIDDNGAQYEMAGVLPGYSQMTKGLQRFGYSEGLAEQDTLLANKGEVLRGHEFHHSEFITDLPCAFTMYKKRDQEIVQEWQGGYQLGNTLASYLHVHFYQRPEMLCRWLDKV